MWVYSGRLVHYLAQQNEYLECSSKALQRTRTIKRGLISDKDRGQHPHSVMDGHQETYGKYEIKMCS